jgi:hypothetical protein
MIAEYLENTRSKRGNAPRAQAGQKTVNGRRVTTPNLVKTTPEHHKRRGVESLSLNLKSDRRR